jgi:glucose/arabinose dehydrogenase
MRRLAAVAFWCVAALGAALLALLATALAGVAPVESPAPVSTAETAPAPPRQQLQTTAPTAPSIPTTTAAAATTPAPATAPVPVTVTVTAARGDSWISARLGSETGRVLEERILPQGETARMRGRRVWLLVGASANVDVTVDGEARPLSPGTVETLFSAAR